MENEAIEFNKPLPDGAFANFSATHETIAAMYPMHADGGQMHSATLGDGVVGFNTELRFVSDGDDRLAVLGNTKTGTCPVAADCGSCALSGSGLSIQEMSERNCARANTAAGFEELGQTSEGRFMLLPLSNNVLILDDTTDLTAEYNGDQLMQYRLPDAAAVVLTDSWLRSRNLETIAFAMNGADGSFGMAETDIEGQHIYVPFCSLRGNMGDRGEEAQIIRKALNKYLDTLDITDGTRQGIIDDLKVNVVLSASAELKNFAHKIQVPEEGSKYAVQLHERYPDLIARANGRVTSAIVLNDQYPGAFGRGSIFPQFEAEMGIHESPITPDNCPGDGQTCHVDYRVETEYAIRNQLEQMGVRPDNILYDDSKALDPAAPDNNMASNRREQNNGVPVPKTSRTLNGVQVRVHSR